MAISKIENSSLATGSVTQSTLGSGVTGNGPAFSAYQSSAQTITQGVFTKLQIGVEEFDTGGCYDTSTYRFTPSIAGYYHINGAYQSAGVPTSAGETYVTIFKNGGRFKDARQQTPSGSSWNANVSSIVYFNGTTDYVEMYVYLTGASTMGVRTELFATYFNGALVRAA